MGAPAQCPGQLQASIIFTLFFLLKSLSKFELSGVSRQRAVTTSPKLIRIYSMGKPIKKRITSDDAPERTLRDARGLRKAKMDNAPGWDSFNRRGRGPLFNRLATLRALNSWRTAYKGAIVSRRSTYKGPYKLVVCL